ncbi:hypothetical protein C0995_004303 [Termitomyces sp. Mi166|nr:hypothetical protein C0995_004303 [Termitomyces sp. Mi166\
MPLMLAKYNPCKLMPAFIKATLKFNAKRVLLASSASVTMVAVFEDLSDENMSNNAGDEYAHTAIDKNSRFDLLHPPDPKKKCDVTPVKPHIKQCEKTKAKQVKKKRIKKK